MKKITQDDVWGTFDEDFNLVTRGMIVAQGNPYDKPEEEQERLDLIKKIQVPDICPIWKDRLPYKSVTVVCNVDQSGEVESWLSYVHGGDCISKIKMLPNNKVAFRSNYMCW